VYYLLCNCILASTHSCHELRMSTFNKEQWWWWWWWCIVVLCWCRSARSSWRHWSYWSNRCSRRYRQCRWHWRFWTYRWNWPNRTVWTTRTLGRNRRHRFTLLTDFVTIVHIGIQSFTMPPTAVYVICYSNKMISITDECWTALYSMVLMDS